MFIRVLVGLEAGIIFFIKKLHGFFMCVLSPALFETKRAAKRVGIGQEIVLKNNIKKAVDRPV